MQFYPKSEMTSVAAVTVKGDTVSVLERQAQSSS